MKVKFVSCVAAAAGLLAMAVPPASASPDPYIGEVTIYPYNFCPRGWMPAHGQLLPIAEYNALFSLYGTTFGGDGRTTFGLPDLRGRVAVGTGAGPGLTERRWGEKFGSETATLTQQQLPSHSHEAAVIASTGEPDVASPAGSAVADFTGADYDTYSTGAPSDAMADGSVVISNTGGGQPVNIMQPSTGLQYCVALHGIYPSRN